MKFIDRYKHMQCNFNDIHSAIDYWHTDYNGDLELREMLGLSRIEYNLFVKSEDAFKKYLYNRYANYDFNTSMMWDDDGIEILDFINWHLINGDCDFVDVNMSLSPKLYEDNETK